MYKRLLNKSYFALCAANFLLVLAQRMTNSVLSLYTNELGATAAITGLLSSAFTITSLLFIPFSGQIVNHFSKKKITIISIMIISFATFGFGISNNVYMILFFRLIQGIGLAFSGVALLTLLAENVDKEFLSFGIAYYSICTSLAQAIGPELGLRLIDYVSYTDSFKIDSIIIVLSIAFILMVHSDYKNNDRFSFSIKNVIARDAFIPAILILLVSGSNYTITSFITLFGKEAQINNIGLYFTVNAIALIAVRPISDRILKKIKTFKMLIISLAFLGGSLVLLGTFNSLTMICVASIINAFGYGNSLSLIESLCLRSVPENQKALASATNQIGSNLGILFGPIIAGYLRDLFNYETMFKSMSLFICLAIVIVLFNRRLLRKISEEVV